MEERKMPAVQIETVPQELDPVPEGESPVPKELSPPAADDDVPDQ
jgi:hypothetical protein